MKKYLLVFAFSFFEFFVFGQSKLQSLNSDWPNDWKIIVLFHDSTTHQSITQLIPNNENIAKWSIIGNMMVLKNYKSQSLETVLNVFLKTHKEESSKAKIKILERNDSSKKIWALYKVEISDFPNDPIPESKSNYIIQGESSLFMTFIIIKEATLSDEFVLKWSKILKGSRLVYK